MEDTLNEEIQTLSMQESSALTQIMPKTKINHAILHENVSQERHLQIKLASLEARRQNALNTLDISKRNFLEKQSRKRVKWKLQDETRVSGMTLPQINPEISRRPSMMTIYKSPQYNNGETSLEVKDVTLLPFMNLRRERTEIIHHHDNIFLTHLPTVVEVDSFKLKRYNTFCAPEKQRIGEPLRDKRFRKMLKSLSTNQTKESFKKSKERSEFDTNVTRSAPVASDERSTDDSEDYQQSYHTKTPLEARVIYPVKTFKPRHDTNGLTQDERLQYLQPDDATFDLKIGSRSVKSGDASRGHEKIVKDIMDPNGLCRELTKIKQEQIQSDLKHKDLQQLKQSYGKLRNSKRKHNIRKQYSEKHRKSLSLAKE